MSDVAPTPPPGPAGPSPRLRIEQGGVPGFDLPPLARSPVPEYLELYWQRILASQSRSPKPDGVVSALGNIRKRLTRRNSESLNISDRASALFSTWGHSEGIRELLQNLFDEVSDRNKVDGHASYRGISVTRASVGDADVDRIHTTSHVLADVVLRSEARKFYGARERREIKEPIRCNVLEFINYGTGPGTEILMMGHSTKQERKDQIGCHGEGLKMAIKIFLRTGLDVEIETTPNAIDGISQPTQKWRFFVANHMVRYAIQPIEACRGPLCPTAVSDLDRFVIRVAWPAEDLGTSLSMAVRFDDWLLPMELHADHARVLNGEYMGRMYVHHFKVMDTSGFYFGYDLPVPVGRDRDQFKTKETNEAVALAWSSVMVLYPDDDPLKKQLIRTFLLWTGVSAARIRRSPFNGNPMKGLPDGAAECGVLHMVSVEAKEVLSRAWWSLHEDASPKIVPVPRNSKAEVSACTFLGLTPVHLSETPYAIVSLDRSPPSKLLADEFAKLRAAEPIYPPDVTKFYLEILWKATARKALSLKIVNIKSPILSVYVTDIKQVIVNLNDEDLASGSKDAHAKAMSEASGVFHGMMEILLTIVDNVPGPKIETCSRRLMELVMEYARGIKGPDPQKPVPGSLPSIMFLAPGLPATAPPRAPPPAPPPVPPLPAEESFLVLTIVPKDAGTHAKPVRTIAVAVDASMDPSWDARLQADVASLRVEESRGTKRKAVSQVAKA